MKARNHTFTLIEVLVVSAIFIMLFTLLQPSLKKIMASSKSVTCKSQLKQINKGVHMYMEDWSGWIPVMGRNRWTWETAPYLDFKVPQVYNEMTVHNFIDARNTIMECPDFDRDSNPLTLPPVIGGYAANFRYLTHTLKTQKRKHFSQVELPKDTLVIGDGSDVAKIWWHLRYLYSAPTYMTYTRHQEGINLFFLDGHVDYFDWDELMLGRNGDTRYYYKLTK